MTDYRTDESALSIETTRRALLQAAAGAGVVSTAGCAGVTTPVDIAEAGDVTGRVEYFKSAAWLADHRDSVTVIDARPDEAYRTERIYGARQVALDDVTKVEETPDGIIPSAAALAEAFGRAGIPPAADVVVYGGSVGSRVSRIVFALAYLGHRGDLSVLNGGFEAWGGRVGVGDREVNEVRYEPTPQDTLVVTREWLADRVGSFNADGPGLVDTRAPEAYLGATGSSKLVESNARHGHLPGAVNVNWIGNVSGRYLGDPSQLSRLYGSEAGLSRGGPTVVYGQEAVNPTHTWLVLRALGFEDVRLYEGGFREWATVAAAERGRYPVETKTHVVIETDGELGGGSDGGFSCTG